LRPGLVVADIGRDSAAPRRAAGPSPADPEKLTLGRHVIEFFKELTAVIVGAIIVASLLRGFVGQMFLIPSASMQNTLQVQDRVVVEKLSSIKRGQIVVFADPGDWLSGPVPPERGPVGKALQFVGVLPDPSSEHLIKRVIGMPGDTVACCDANGRITVNGHSLDERGYLYTPPDGTQVEPSTVRFEVVVPAEHLFVLGDNREHSRDSRCHLNDVVQTNGAKGQNAFVPEGLVVGHAAAVAWPFERRQRLRVPDTFDAVLSGRQPAPDLPQITAGAEASC
jgi:signal peptidase I